jgi:hypothetical protein
LKAKWPGNSPAPLLSHQKSKILPTDSQIYRKAIKERKVAQRNMGYRKNPVLAFAFLCDHCGFAVRNWQLLALSHPR